MMQICIALKDRCTRFSEFPKTLIIRTEVIGMPTEKPRYTIIVDDELLKKIDDFRFENRYPSRSAATLDLIRIGMEVLEKQQAEQKKAQKNK